VYSHYFLVVFFCRNYSNVSFVYIIDEKIFLKFILLLFIRSHGIPSFETAPLELAQDLRIRHHRLSLQVTTKYHSERYCLWVAGRNSARRPLMKKLLMIILRCKLLFVLIRYDIGILFALPPDNELQLYCSCKQVHILDVTI